MNLISTKTPNPTRARSILQIVGCVVLAIACYLLIDGGYIGTRFLSLGIRAGEIISWSEYISKRGSYVAMHVLALTTLVLFAISKRRVLFLPVLLLLFIATGLDLAYYFTSGRYASVSDIGVLLEAIGNTSDAISEYKWTTLGGYAAATLFFVLVGALSFVIRSTVTYERTGRAGLIGLLLLFGCFYWLGSVKGDAGLVGFPRGYSSLFAAGITRLTNTSGKDTGFSHLHNITPPFEFDKIVVVMDESVVGAEFKALMDKNTTSHNYLHRGKVYSGANISAASNYFFRKVAYINGEMIQIASLFEIAKKSGFNTLYIDDQSVLANSGARNYFDARELAFVDRIVANDDKLRYLRDSASLRQVQEALKTLGKVFIFINKIGAHVPYEITIPPNYRSGNRLDDYRTSVRINSVQYILQLTKILDDKSVLIYTSDHGQNFGMGPTHGNSGDEASISEWDVPFDVASGNTVFIQQLTNTLRSDLYMSHFDISEIIRNILGYGLDKSKLAAKANTIGSHGYAYCGHFGPPHSSFGTSNSSPHCKLLPP